VKKAAPKGGRVGKKSNARTAMVKMQAYCKFATFGASRRVIWTRSSRRCDDVLFDEWTH
jgi:hypothetical protein